MNLIIFFKLMNLPLSNFYIFKKIIHGKIHLTKKQNKTEQNKEQKQITVNVRMEVLLFKKLLKYCISWQFLFYSSFII